MAHTQVSPVSTWARRRRRRSAQSTERSPGSERVLSTGFTSPCDGETSLSNALLAGASRHSACRGDIVVTRTVVCAGSAFLLTHRRVPLQSLKCRLGSSFPRSSFDPYLTWRRLFVVPCLACRPYYVRSISSITTSSENTTAFACDAPSKILPPCTAFPAVLAHTASDPFRAPREDGCLGYTLLLASRAAGSRTRSGGH